MQTLVVSDSVDGSPARMDPIVVRANEGESVDLGDHRGRVILNAAGTGGALLFGELTVDPQGGPPPHIHRHEDEVFQILEGRFEMRIGEDTFFVEAGDTVFGPRGVAHGWRCVSETQGRMFGIVTPGANFEAFGLAMEKLGASPAAMMEDPSIMEKFVAQSREHGIEMLPPGG